jgi:hypothetical protein
MSGMVTLRTFYALFRQVLRAAISNADVRGTGLKRGTAGAAAQIGSRL